MRYVIQEPEVDDEFDDGTTQFRVEPCDVFWYLGFQWEVVLAQKDRILLRHCESYRLVDGEELLQFLANGRKIRTDMEFDGIWFRVKLESELIHVGTWFYSPYRAGIFGSVMGLGFHYGLETIRAYPAYKLEYYPCVDF